jgi:hypothetical protein
MSLIKLAVEQQQKTGIVGWAKRHPIIASGVALTGGLAAADAGLASFNKLREIGGGESGAFKRGLSSFKNNTNGTRAAIGKAAKHGLGQGAIYGGILSTVEPAISYGGFKKKVE